MSIENSAIIAELLKARHPSELRSILLNRNQRRALLKDLENFYLWHVPGFTALKTLQVLHDVL